MKYLVISDTHLNKFQKRKFEHLKKLIEEADQVIIAGDFWEGYLVSYNRFINSRWNSLFPLLLEKNAIYIPGNHDPLKKSFIDEVPFAKEIKAEHILHIGGRKYIFRHGHDVVPALDSTVPFLFANRYAIWLGQLFEQFFVGIFGHLSLKIVYKPANFLALRWVKKHIRGEDILVMGHTHYQIDAPSQNYINTGLFNWGYAQHLWITEKGHYLVNDKY